MRLRRLLATAALCASALAAGPADAAQCTVSGSGAEFEVRRIDPSPQERGLGLFLEHGKTPTATPASAAESNWHSFGGVWLINKSSGDASFIFRAQNAFGPPTVVVGAMGQEHKVEVFTEDAIVNNPFALTIFPTLHATKTYYLVGFGSGSGTWEGTASIGGASTSCTPLKVEGEIFDYDASDFTGGTHVMVPGFGHGEDITLTHSNPRQFMVGALFAAMPEPLPPTSVGIVTEGFTQTVTQRIMTINSPRHDWSFTANYTGDPSYAPLLRLLQLDLDIGV